MLEIYNRRLFWGLIVGLVLRMTMITIPILEVEPFEQCQMAWLARDLFENWFRFPSEHYAFASGSIYPYILALGYVVCGGVFEWSGRFLAILFALGTVRYIFLLVKFLADKKTAVWSVLVYWLSPLSIIYTRTLLPESALVFCSVAAIYYIYMWGEGHGRNDWIKAAFLCALAMLIRMSSLYLLVPLIFMIWKKEGLEMFWQRRLWGLLAISLGISGVWQYVHQAEGIVQPWLLASLWEHFSWKVLLSLAYWENILGYLAGKTLTPIGLFLFFVAVWKNRKRDLGIVPIWFGSVVVYLLLLTSLTAHEKFYLLPLLVIASIYIGLDLGKGNLGCSFAISSKVKGLLNVVVVIAILVQLSMAYSLPDHYKYTQEAGQDLQHYAEDQDLVLSTRRLYYCHRKGWTMSLIRDLDTDLLIRNFEDARAKGARYFVMTELNNYEHHKLFLSHVLDTCEEIVVRKKYRIYRMN